MPGTLDCEKPATCLRLAGLAASLEHRPRESKANIMSTDLSSEEREILETIRDGNFTHSAWVDSDSILELTGPADSILRIPQDTATRLTSFVQFAPVSQQPRRLFNLSEAGEMALAVEPEPAPSAMGPR